MSSWSLTRFTRYGISVLRCPIGYAVFLLDAHTKVTVNIAVKQLFFVWSYAIWWCLMPAAKTASTLAAKEKSQQFGQDKKRGDRRRIRNGCIPLRLRSFGVASFQWKFDPSNCVVLAVVVSDLI